MSLAYLEALETPVSDHCSSAFVAIPATATLGEARKLISQHRLQRHNSSAGKAVYYYLVSEQGILEGVLPLFAMACNLDDVLVSKLAIRKPQLLVLRHNHTFGFGLEQLLINRFRALPVVDDEGKLICVLDFSAAQGTREGFTEAQLREELEQVLGFSASKMRTANVRQALWMRGPWLNVTLLAGLACALAITKASVVLEQMPIFIAFIPLVLALGDATCHQATSVAVIRQVGVYPKLRQILEWLRDEIAISGSLGLGSAAVIAIFAGLWFASGQLAIMLAISIVSAMTWGGLIGFLVPTLLRRTKWDPHGASGPISLGLADLATTVSMIIVAFVFLFWLAAR